MKGIMGSNSESGPMHNSPGQDSMHACDRYRDQEEQGEPDYEFPVSARSFSSQVRMSWSTSGYCRGMRTGRPLFPIRQ